MGRCSNRQQKELPGGCISSSFSFRTGGIPIALQATMKPTLIILAFISLAMLAIDFSRIVPARASATPGGEPVSAESCVDRYNSLLKNAKTALSAGDRAATIDLLERAKQMLPACPALRDGASPRSC
jgi:hypothetical protein